MNTNFKIILVWELNPGLSTTRRTLITRTDWISSAADIQTFVENLRFVKN